MTEGSASDSYQSNHVDKQTLMNLNVIAEEIPIVSQTLKRSQEREPSSSYEITI